MFLKTQSWGKIFIFGVYRCFSDPGVHYHSNLIPFMSSARSSQQPHWDDSEVLGCTGAGLRLITQVAPFLLSYTLLEIKQFPSKTVGGHRQFVLYCMPEPMTPSLPAFESPVICHEILPFLLSAIAQPAMCQAASVCGHFSLQCSS